MKTYQIYCINLERRPDRWEHINKQSAGLNIQRIDAVDMKARDFKHLAKELPKTGPLGSLGDGTLACTLSHKKTWQAFLASNDDYAIVFEDDVQISSDFKPFIDTLIPQLEHADLIKLEAELKKPKTILMGDTVFRFKNRQVSRCHQLYSCSGGYVISRKGAQKAISMLEHCNVPIDHFLFYPKARKGVAGIPFYATHPGVVAQDKGIESNIAGNRGSRRALKTRISRGLYDIAPSVNMLKKLIYGARFIETAFAEGSGTAEVRFSDHFSNNLVATENLSPDQCKSDGPAEIIEASEKLRVKNLEVENNEV